MLLNIPDFRTHERAFQQLFQVAGRSGRGSKQGQVMIQTSQTGHPVIQAVFTDDYVGLAADEIQLRKEYHYPPFNRLIKVMVKHKDARIAEEASKSFAVMVSSVLQDRLIGPQAPSISRVRNYYLQQMLIKLDKKRDDPDKVKALLWNASMKLTLNPKFKGVLFDFDVDPA
jgi:primosomal protein N' (replication factor Y)